MHALAGYSKTGETPLTFNQDWAKLGYQYDMSNPNDVRGAIWEEREPVYDLPFLTDPIVKIK